MLGDRELARLFGRFMPMRRMSASENADSEPGVKRGSEPLEASEPRSSIVSEIDVSVVAREEEEPHFETLLASAVRPV